MNSYILMYAIPVLMGSWLGPYSWKYRSVNYCITIMDFCDTIITLLILLHITTCVAVSDACSSEGYDILYSSAYICYEFSILWRHYWLFTGTLARTVYKHIVNSIDYQLPLSHAPYSLVIGLLSDVECMSPSQFNDMQLEEVGYEPQLTSDCTIRRGNWNWYYHFEIVSVFRLLIPKNSWCPYYVSPTWYWLVWCESF